MKCHECLMNCLKRQTQHCLTYYNTFESQIIVLKTLLFSCGSVFFTENLTLFLPVVVQLNFSLLTPTPPRRIIFQIQHIAEGKCAFSFFATDLVRSV